MCENVFFFFSLAFSFPNGYNFYSCNNNRYKEKQIHWTKKNNKNLNKDLQTTFKRNENKNGKTPHFQGIQRRTEIHPNRKLIWRVKKEHHCGLTTPWMVMVVVVMVVVVAVIIVIIIICASALVVDGVFAICLFAIAIALLTSEFLFRKHSSKVFIELFCAGACTSSSSPPCSQFMKI